MQGYRTHIALNGGVVGVEQVSPFGTHKCRDSVATVEGKRVGFLVFFFFVVLKRKCASIVGVFGDLFFTNSFLSPNNRTHIYVHDTS